RRPRTRRRRAGSLPARRRCNARRARAAPRPGTPGGRSLCEVRLQRLEPGLEHLVGVEVLPVVELVGRAVEGDGPLDEGLVRVRDRQDVDGRDVVLDALEGMLEEVVGVETVAVRMREQLLAELRAVRQREAADGPDLVSGFAVLDLARRDELRV